MNLQISKTKPHHGVFYAVAIISGALVTGAIMSLFISHRAYAVTANDRYIPLQVKAQAVIECNATGNNVAQLYWLSLPKPPDSNDLVQSTTARPGDQITLQFNTAVYYCKNINTDLTLVTNNLVDDVTDSTGTDSFNNLDNKQLEVAYDHNHLWSQNQLAFLYVVPNIRPGVHSITVGATIQSVNQFDTSDNRYQFQCVGTPPHQQRTWNVNRGRIDNFTTPNVCPNFHPTMGITIIVPNPPTFSCGGGSFSPPSPEVNTPVSATVNVNYQYATPVYNSPPNNYSLNIQATGAGLNYSSVNVPYNTNGSQAFSTVALGSPSTSGTITLTWQFYSPDGTQVAGCPASGSPPVQTKAAYKPYMKVYGGDISAGGGFEDANSNCSTTSNQAAEIIGWNHENGAPPPPAFFGAGAEFSAEALSDIKNFATRQGAGTGDSLSFANTVNNSPATGQFGGRFSGVPCAHDYFSAHTSATPIAPQPLGIPGSGTIAPSIPNLESTASGNYEVTNANPGFWVQNVGAQPIDPSKQLTLYVRGNVLIRNNIAYDNSVAWSLGQIPSFRLIVEGNIFIDSSVSQLDGLYVAEPYPASSTTTGFIYDCTGSHTFAPESTVGGGFATDCQSTPNLTVGGGFIAKQVKFMRTNNSLSKSSNDPLGAGQCLEVGSCPSKAAEIFNYSPELWLSNSSTTGPVKFDSISSLPPVL